MQDSQQTPAGRVYFEFVRLGGQVRVSAIDERTGVEVTAITPANATEQQMRQLAMGKLKRRLSQLSD